MSVGLSICTRVNVYEVLAYSRNLDAMFDLCTSLFWCVCVRVYFHLLFFHIFTEFFRRFLSSFGFTYISSFLFDLCFRWQWLNATKSLPEIHLCYFLLFSIIYTLWLAIFPLFHLFFFKLFSLISSFFSFTFLRVFFPFFKFFPLISYFFFSSLFLFLF